MVETRREAPGHLWTFLDFSTYSISISLYKYSNPEVHAHTSMESDNLIQDQDAIEHVQFATPSFSLTNPTLAMQYEGQEEGPGTRSSESLPLD